ncbi:alpha/beta hydrolase [Sulfuritalea sp.]|uniref:alpha/beta hydrolase n=1 Tax=Sulfuritalea sp. TaxID=2480090 RepID=UPI001AD49EC9|nr:alpha/beta hydrolase [Sulfuritalea sp.]MBN8473427.1 alpha/beta hydrolase [Sulfuritalea sp.]
MLTPEQLESEYNARAAIADHPQIFERWREESGAARARLQVDADRRFGPAPAETLDFYPTAGRNAALLVFIHGGYWRSLDKQDFSFLAPTFVDAGVAVAMPNYGLAPATPIAEMVRQMLRALAALYRDASQLGIDRGRIVVAGHSAGAHLAAMMLAADWPRWSPDLPADLLHGAVCISGIYDLRPLVHAAFLQDDLRLDTRSAKFVSPVNYRPGLAMPLITAVGADESAEFRRQNRLIRSAWPHCFRDDLPLPGRHHLASVEALGAASHPLFGATMRLLLGRS